MLQLINATGGIVNKLFAIVVGIALIAFFWGLVKFIFVQGSETAKDDSKRVILWGLIALFVMVSVWGIVALIQRNLNLPVI